MRAGVVSAVVALAGFAQGNTWVSDFHVDKADFASTGRNDYFSLEPGRVQTSTPSRMRPVAQNARGSGRR